MTQTAEKVETQQQAEYVVRGADLPARIVHDPEIVEELSATWSEIAMRDVAKIDQRIDEFRKFVENTVRLTYAEDWVLYSTPAGQFAYLQDVGCQRIETVWGISFDPVNLITDFEKEALGDEDRNLGFMCVARARSSVTGASVDEIGWRQSGPEGLFAKAWKGAKDQPAERKRIEVDVRKSSLANARGRAIRKITGLNRMPVRVLSEIGLDVKKCAGVRFQTGVQGGAGEDVASSKQLYLLVSKAANDKKVAGFDRGNRKRLQEYIDAAGIQAKTAHTVIDWLENAAAGSIQPAEFWAKLGVEPLGKDKPAEKPADPAGKLTPEQAEAAARAKSPTVCPECERTWELVKDKGHSEG